MKQKLATILKSFIALALLGSFFSALAAWNNAPANPPANNARPPINTSLTGQKKDGTLIAGALRADTTMVAVESALVGALDLPVASAALELRGTNKGLLVNRMSLAQRDAIAAPANGLLIYQLDGAPGFYYFNGTGWAPFGTGGGGGGSPSGIWTKNGTNIYPTSYTTDKVGIGTATPTEFLHVVGNIVTTGVIKTPLGSAASPSYTFSSDLNTGIYSSVADSLDFATGGVKRLSINSNGELTVSSLAGPDEKRVCVDTLGKIGECTGPFNVLTGVDRVVTFSVKYENDSNGNPTFTLTNSSLLSSNNVSDLNKEVTVCNVAIIGGGSNNSFRAHYDTIGSPCTAGSGDNIDSVDVISAQVIIKGGSSKWIEMLDTNPADKVEFASHSSNGGYLPLQPGDVVNFLVQWPAVGN